MSESADSNHEPVMYEASWQRSQIEQLFEDLRQGAIIKHVQVRTHGDNSLGDQAVTLEQAAALFREDAATAIQIRYAFDGDVWCDTLMVHSDAVRIIRTQLAPDD